MRRLLRNARSALPWGALFFGGLGAAAIVRAVYRPKRIVMDGAFAQSCPGAAGCDPGVILQAYSGSQPVYAMAPGIVNAGGAVVTIVASDESVVLEYSGLDQLQVSTGRVGIGQQLGLAHQLRFTVHQLERAADGSAHRGKAYEPVSWLATHGLALSVPAAPGHVGQWCEMRRQLVVPQKVATCGIQLPEPQAWSLLPVKISLS